MTRKSQDAAKIMALPAARHPQLYPLLKALSERVDCDLGNAEAIIDAAAKDFGITHLDLEWLNPANATRVPFAPQIVSNRQHSFADGINQHLNILLNDRRT